MECELCVGLATWSSSYSSHRWQSLFTGEKPVSATNDVLCDINPDRTPSPPNLTAPMILILIRHVMAWTEVKQGGNQRFIIHWQADRKCSWCTCTTSGFFQVIAASYSWSQPKTLDSQVFCDKNGYLFSNCNRGAERVRSNVFRSNTTIYQMHNLLYQVDAQDIQWHTCNLQTLCSIHVQPGVHYASVLSRFHGTCPNLRRLLFKKIDTDDTNRVACCRHNFSVEPVNCFVIFLGISNVRATDVDRSLRIFGPRDAACWEFRMCQRVITSIWLHPAYNFSTSFIAPPQHGQIFGSFSCTQASELLV